MYGKKERIKLMLLDLLLAAVGIVAIFFVTLFFQTNFAISQQKENSKDKIDTAVERIESNESESAERYAQFDAFSQAKVDSIAYYYEGMPDDYKSVSGMANQWALSELYILDNNRKLIASNGGSVKDFSSGDVAALWNGESKVTIGNLNYYIAYMDDGNFIIGARDNTDFLAEEENLTSLKYSLHSIKIGSKGYIAVINADDQKIVYHPEESYVGKSVSDAGLDATVMNDGYEGWVNFSGEEFYCESRLVSHEDTNYQFIALRPRSMMESSIYKLVWLITLIFAVIILLAVMYINFVRAEQDRSYIVDGKEMEYVHIGGKIFFNKTIGSRTVHVLLIGLIVIFLSTFYIQTLSVLSNRSARSSEKIDDVTAIFDENQTLIDDLKATYEEEYVGRTQNIAYLIGKDPTLVSNDRLMELAKRAQIKYIYIFNDQGTIDCSNGMLSDFSLSRDSTHNSYKFWGLILGSKDVVVMPAETDVYEAGSYIQYIGVPRLDATGMVELGISPTRLQNKIHALTTANTLSNIAVENGGFTVAVDNETKNITYYSDENLIDSPAASLGITENALIDDYTGYQTINGQQCFVSSMKYGTELIYICVPMSKLTSGRLPLAGVVTGASFVILLLIVLFSLIGRPDKMLKKVEKSKDGEPLAEPTGTFEVVSGSGKVRKVESLKSRWSLSGTKWADCTAEQKLKKLLFGICGIAAIFLVFYMISQQNSYDRNSILSYIVNKRWELKPNIFSLTYIAFIIIEVVVIATAIRGVLSFVVSSMGARAETIGRLLNSFIKYMSVLGTLFYCTYFLGVDTSTILASAGLLSLVVGLGAQSLIGDILAGIFIVFENEFRVGDIVTLDGWRGIVREIGIRSTKVEDFTQDIKVINNSKISGVVNMTKKYSFASVDVGIEYDESLERVEAILQEELPIIGEKHPDIIAGPFYKGVVSLGDSSVNIKIVAQCAEAKRVQIVRDLNREIKLIFDKHNVNIPFPQVVVNKPNKHEKATIQEQIAAEKFVEEQKEKTKNIGEEVNEEDKNT